MELISFSTEEGKEKLWIAVENSGGAGFHTSPPHRRTQVADDVSLRILYNLERNQHFHKRYEYESLLSLQ
jgi:hypothetical protein